MIVIIDYGMGNLYSVLKAFQRIHKDVVVSSNAEDILKADKLVLPGIGHFKKGMENLKKLGLIELLNKKVIEENTPILGICLGMQLYGNSSEEGNVQGLGWIDAETKRLDPRSKLKIPHMGWNNVKIEKEDLILSGIDKSEQFYFVHSFHIKCNNANDVLTTTDYGGRFVSAIQKNNIYGMQFHPEKSHDAGLQILRNFVNI